ncbi:MAG: VWA domain-containing protein [Microthrixaceae bacterium]|nr:VWA domain-containing protein [Microthrixaceae bacterium]
MSVRHRKSNSGSRAAGRSSRERPIAVVGVLGLLAMVMSFLPSARVSATPAQDGNPDLPQRCGLDMTIIIDRSGSIGSYNDEMADAANALIGGVSNTGSRVQVISFSSTATAVTLAGGVGSSSNISDLRLLPAEDVQLPAYNSSGGTNWDDALEMARRQPAVTPLTVVLTDGNPTYHNSGSGVNGHGNSLGGSGSYTSSNDINKAVAEADLLKAAGTHVLAVGIGGNLNTSNLSAISGDERLTSTNGMSFAEADWTTVGFAELKTLLEDFVKELCAPSLNITKTEIPLEGDERPGNSWEFELELGSAPAEWENPQQGAAETTATQTTVDGKANFKWEQGATATIGASVTEQARAGWTFESATCQRRNYDTGATSVLELTPQVGPDGSVSWVVPGGLGPADSVNCNVRNREVAPARIDVRKVTLPAGVAGEFDFALTGPGVDRQLADLGHGDTATFGEVPPGTYSVTEDDSTNFSLDSAVCDNTDTAPVETVDPAALVVGEGERWLCTFTNEAAPGSITVRKAAEGADGTFAFESDFAGDFELTTADGEASTVANAVQPGSYSVVELTPQRWTQVSATCSDGSAVGDIRVGPGEDVVCTFTNLAPNPTLGVTKSASVSSVDEPGDTVTFTVGITNTSVEPLEIDSLVDSVDGGAPLDVTALAVTDCDDLVGLTLAPGESTSCTFDLLVEGDAGDVVADVVTVSAHDSDDNVVEDSDGASVGIDDVTPRVEVTKTAGTASVAEPGAEVTFAVAVSNPGIEAIQVDSLTDSIAGGPAIDIATTGSVVKATTCGTVVGSSIEPGASADCTFTVEVSGAGGTTVRDVVEVEASDDDGNDAADSDDARVDISDVVPTVSITKTAGQTSVSEHGAEVTFGFVIENTAAEAVEITSLVDTVFGDITAECGLAGDVLAPADGQPGTGPDSSRCEVTRFLSGNAGDAHHNVATVTVADDDGNSATATDDATVGFTDTLPGISVDKDAGAASVDEPGALVEFTATMTNSGVEPVTITSVTDSVAGGTPFDVTRAGGPVVSTSCGAAVGTVVAPGGTYQCSFEVLVAGNAGDTVADVVRFTAVDDEGNVATDDADESVDVDDVLPSVLVSKEASVSEVAEPGADVEFTFVVSNTSVEDVTVTSLVDSVFGDLTAECGVSGVVLAPGGSAECTVSRFVGGNAGDVHENTVVVTAVDDEGNVATDDAEEDVDVADALPSIEVTKDDGDASVSAPGGVVGYTVRIVNTSAEAVKVKSISDSVDGGGPIDVTVVEAPVTASTCELGTEIAAGGTYECSFEIVVEGDGSSAVFDVVTATVTDDEENEAADTDDEQTPVDPVADLSVDKTADVAELNSGDQVSYTLTVTNDGPSTAEEVVLTDELPDGLTLVSAEGAADEEWDCGSTEGSSVSCRLLALAAGESASVTIVATVDAEPGAIRNTAVVGSQTEDPDETDNSDDEDIDVVEEPVAPTPTEPAPVVESVSAVPATGALTGQSVQQPLAYTGGSSLWLGIGGLLVVLAGLGILSVGRGRREGSEGAS